MSGRGTSRRLRMKKGAQAVSPQAKGKIAARKGLRTADCPYSGPDNSHGKRHAWLRGYAQERTAMRAK